MMLPWLYMALKKPNHGVESVDYSRVGGYLFLAVAFLMLFSETSRGLAVAFFAIGIALVVVKHDDATRKKK